MLLFYYSISIGGSMKTTATMALKKGMIIGEDVLNFKKELLIPRKTTVDDAVISKLMRHSIMCVEILEPVDLASTHFEKVSLSEGFKKFLEAYNDGLSRYKNMISALISDGTPLDIQGLFKIYTDISGKAKTGEILLDYLYNMLPSEDDLTYAHCLNAALIAGVFGTWLGFSREEEITLIFCGFLYDIGKFVLPYELIWKPGKLTDSEYEIIKTHTIKGYELIKNQRLNKNVIEVTTQHHERCNGTGYPNKLKDNEINKFAKVISIIDAYEAMTSARTYRETMIPFQVIKNFEKSADFYSSIILNTVLSHIATAQLGMTVRLNDDSIAEVVLINQKKLSRPLVKINDVVVDLYAYPQLEIVAIL